MNENELNNLKIGECFTIGNKKIKIEKHTCCDDCCFDRDNCVALKQYNLRPECVSLRRKDQTDVIFVEVEDEI